MTPGIPDRLVRVCDIGPRDFLAVFTEDVFDAARPIQRHERVLNVTGVGLSKPIDVIRLAFGLGKVEYAGDNFGQLSLTTSPSGLSMS